MTRAEIKADIAILRLDPDFAAELGITEDIIELRSLALDVIECRQQKERRRRKWSEYCMGGL